jgi:hypothetical protein
MQWDPQLAADPNNVKETGMTVKNFDMNDELGRVCLANIFLPASIQSQCSFTLIQ